MIGGVCHQGDGKILRDDKIVLHLDSRCYYTTLFVKNQKIVTKNGVFYCMHINNFLKSLFGK